MKITDLKMIHIRPRWMFLKIETDEGICGWGEPVVEGRARTVETAVNEFRPMLIGADPLKIEHLWQGMYRRTFYRGGPILCSAISGIEMALWDIKGKYYNMPVFEMLGGAYRDKVRMYGHLKPTGHPGDFPIPDMLKITDKRLADGFTVMKYSIIPPIRPIDNMEMVDKVVERFAAVRERVLAIKRANKESFAEFARRNDSFALNTEAIMDVQVKRLHEYKRQLLCAMSIASLQLQLHDDPNREFLPRTFVFGAKAAAGYKTAKRIIELLLSMANDINNDPVCKDKLQVYFVENYRVSAAEAIVPAAQISEQISTAGKEASGTGCMKLMMNGAVTIGTLDGANVEMYERLGDENMFLFGLHTDEIAQLRANGYDPGAIARNDPEISRIFSRFSEGFSDGKSYSDLVSQLLYGGDPYMLIADYRAYADCQKRLYDRISDKSELARLAIMNTAESGIFAADRAISQYAHEIWNVK